MPRVQSPNPSTEVIEAEVIDEASLEKTIDKTLVKRNITDEVINSLKEKYLPLKLENLQDKSGYLVINDARKEVKSIRVLAQNICKHGRAEAIAIQKKWIAKEKEVVGRISEVEDHLQGEVDKFDAEIERVANEKKRIQEENYILRQQELTRMGATYQNGSFVLDDISFEASLVKESDDSIWNETMLPKYKAKYESIEQLRIAEEKKKKEDQEKLDAEKKKFEEDQKLFREQQEQLKKNQEELLQQQRVIELEKEKKETERLNAVVLKRTEQLNKLGMQIRFSENLYFFEDVNVSFMEMKTKDDAEWNRTIAEITPYIEEKKKEADKKRIEELEAEKEKLKQQAIEDEKERKRLEEIKTKEEAAKADDKTKWEAFLNLIKGLELPVMKSGPYRSKMVMVREKIDEITEL